MRTKITLSKDFCEMDAIKHIAFRHSTTPEDVLKHYFVQRNIVAHVDNTTKDYTLTSNELALLHDLGVQPSMIEIQ